MWEDLFLYFFRTSTHVLWRCLFITWMFFTDWITGDKESTKSLKPLKSTWACHTFRFFFAFLSFVLVKEQAALNKNTYFSQTFIRIWCSVWTLGDIRNMHKKTEDEVSSKMLKRLYFCFVHYLFQWIKKPLSKVSVLNMLY